jgi:transposase
MSAPQLCVGLDVAKAQLDMALRPTGERWAVAHDAAGMVTLVARLQAVPPPLMVLEATGGYQRAVVAALAATGLPVVVVNPRQARDFAKATGPLAQTDALEARALAPGAEAVRPTPRPLPDAQADALRALLARRRPLVARRTAEQNRLGSAPPRLQTDIQAPITWLNTRLAALDDDLDTTLRASPVWRAREELLRSVPGIGPVCARTLRLDRPEWGTLHRQRLAALVGVAPFNRDRGTLRGSRTIWGGRAPVRATLQMSTLVAVRYTPVLQAFYDHLRAAGKVAKVALTACMRKLLTILNAMVNHHTPWQPQEVSVNEGQSPLTNKTVAPLLRRCGFQRRLKRGVLAPRKAWRLLQGERPCRVRASHPPVSSLASMAES